MRAEEAPRRLRRRALRPTPPTGPTPTRRDAVTARRSVPSPNTTGASATDAGGSRPPAPRRPDWSPAREASVSGLTEVVTSPARFDEERPLTLAGLESAISASWSLETCDPTDVPTWTPAEPSQGQCAVTALVVHDLPRWRVARGRGAPRRRLAPGLSLLEPLRRRRRRSDPASIQRTERWCRPPHLIERLPAFPWLSPGAVRRLP